MKTLTAKEKAALANAGKALMALGAAPSKPNQIKHPLNLTQGAEKRLKDATAYNSASKAQ